MKLAFEYDEATDVMMIEGVRYHGGLFRTMGLASVGQWIRILERRDDGVLVIDTVGTELQSEFTAKAER